MHRGARWPGEWIADCDVCGFTYPSSKLRKRWDGLMVCREDYESRHPQELLRIHPEHITPPWTRPEPPDRFKLVCAIWESSAYADLATADCAHADVGNPNLPYLFLLDVLNQHILLSGNAPTYGDGQSGFGAGYADNYADNYS